MGGIIEEKYTRIIEVMASSAKPFEMMMGKLIGIGLVGLTQYLIWGIAAAPILFISQSILATQGITLNSIPISSFVCFIIYFVLGYFLFASICVIGGALVTDTDYHIFAASVADSFVYVDDAGDDWGNDMDRGQNLPLRNSDLRQEAEFGRNHSLGTPPLKTQNRKSYFTHISAVPEIVSPRADFGCRYWINHGERGAHGE